MRKALRNRQGSSNGFSPFDRRNEPSPLAVHSVIAPVRGQACNLQFATFKNIQEKTYWVRFARSGRAVVKRGGFLTLALIAFP